MENLIRRKFRKVSSRLRRIFSLRRAEYVQALIWVSWKSPWLNRSSGERNDGMPSMMGNTRPHESQTMSVPRFVTGLLQWVQMNRMAAARSVGVLMRAFWTPG